MIFLHPADIHPPDHIVPLLLRLSKSYIRDDSYQQRILELGK